MLRHVNIYICPIGWCQVNSNSRYKGIYFNIIVGLTNVSAITCYAFLLRNKWGQKVTDNSNRISNSIFNSLGQRIPYTQRYWTLHWNVTDTHGTSVMWTSISGPTQILFSTPMIQSVFNSQEKNFVRKCWTPRKLTMK